jgi:predicted MPP superfamily phosphohydrolase
VSGPLRALRRLGLVVLVLALLIAGLLLWMYANARAMPVVRQVTVALPYPVDAPRRPVTVALLTDTHLSGPDNSMARMERIVAQINALKPDLIVLGGDYMGDDKGGATFRPAASIAPFAALRAPLGTVAVLGNHDNKRWLPKRRVWAQGFSALGITLLDNQAVRRGPLAVGGLRDLYTGKADVSGTLAAMRALGGAPLLLSHGPDIFPGLNPAAPLLALVGHTHCGQVALPLFGAVYVPSRYGTRYACGVYRHGAATMVVSAGVGTSDKPLRAFAPPDIWLVTIRPQ